MTLTYFCDIDTHLKESFRNLYLVAGFLRDTSGARAAALAFRSERTWTLHLIAEAPRVFPRGKTFSYDLLFSRYRRANVAFNFGSSGQSSLYFGCVCLLLLWQRHTFRGNYLKALVSKTTTATATLSCTVIQLGMVLGGDGILDLDLRKKGQNALTYWVFWFQYADHLT